jgi:predicted SAM-dependent methyltransferase
MRRCPGRGRLRCYGDAVALADLRRSRTLRGLREDLQIARRRLRPPQQTPEEIARQTQSDVVERYLASHDVACVEIGAGNTVVEGWLGTDLRPRHREVLQLDATERFPFPDHSLDYVHAEHLIEHISFQQGQRTLAECRRVLKPGGVVRLATPDLALLVAIYRGDAGPEGEHYLKWAYNAFLRKAPHVHPTFLLNHNLRAWGHTFVYDAEVLRMALEDAGFVGIEQCELGESRHERLRGVERHHAKGSEARDRAVRFETMIFEATNPGPAT